MALHLEMQPSDSAVKMIPVHESYENYKPPPYVHSAIRRADCRAAAAGLD
jgi:hypothetical protein